MKTHRLFTATLILLILNTPLFGQERKTATVVSGYLVLQKYCSQCHGEKEQAPGLRVDQRSLLVAKKHLVAGNADASTIWRRAGIDGDMPPQGHPRPTATELQAMREWIEEGAKFPPEPIAHGKSRDAVTRKQIMGHMLKDLRSHDRHDRVFLRYFSLANVHNDPRVADHKFRLHQAALSKTLNSLTWSSRITLPRRVGTSALFAVDLRDFGWTPKHWLTLLTHYPYGLSFCDSDDDELRRLARDIKDITPGVPLNMVRSDWFVSQATRPKLYHQLLNLPRTALSLEQKLNVDVSRDFRLDRLDRAGVIRSFVSSQNRIVDRHEAAYGSYWKSFDFAPKSSSRSNILRFPLGPLSPQSEFQRFAFEHDGGEIIFTLPNGLHGYLLVDRDGGRIDEGPTDIVSDSLKTAGSPSIVNGLSCIACHQHGMKSLTDVVRGGPGVRGTALEKLSRLYASNERMEQLLQQDKSDYLRALTKTIGPIVQVSDDRDRQISEFAEPISVVNAAYQDDLDLQSIALELGISGGAKRLQESVAFNDRLRSLGLGGGVIQRQQWDALQPITSSFHKAAEALSVGVPMTFDDH